MPASRIATCLTLFALTASAARAEPTTVTFDQSIYVDASDHKLKSPEGIACAADGGSVVVADTGNHRLLTYGYKDGRLSGGNELKLSQLTYPVRLQMDSKGNILALDGKTHRIVRLDPKGAFIGLLEVRGASAASLPASFKVDAADSVYVLDGGGRKVLVQDSSGASTRQLELPKTGVFTDIAVDGAGTIYAVDAVGAVVWSADKSGPTFKPLTKSLKDRMSFPAYVTASRGKLFLVDKNGNGIVVLGIDGSFQGRQLSIGWNDGLVYYPSQLCITERGEIFVADRSNNRVQLFTTAAK